MDQEIRNKLRNVVTKCRKLLEDSVSQELMGKYSIFAKKDQVTADPNEYPLTKNDVYAAFVEQGLNRLNGGGMLGAITCRTVFFLSSFQKWREVVLLGIADPTVFADLGYGVLDTAIAETAAYCLRKGIARKDFGGIMAETAA